MFILMMSLPWKRIWLSESHTQNWHSTKKKGWNAGVATKATSLFPFRAASKITFCLPFNAPNIHIYYYSSLHISCGAIPSFETDQHLMCSCGVKQAVPKRGGSFRYPNIASKMHEFQLFFKSNNVVFWHGSPHLMLWNEFKQDFL